MDIQKYIEELVEKYKYKKLPDDLSREVRELYIKEAPIWLKLYEDEEIYSPENIFLAKKLTDRKYVVGDYGLYVEINQRDMIKENLIVKPGQEYRIHDENYAKRVKYNWVCPISLEDVKIYHQKKRVDYADYIPGKFYISPYEVKNKIFGML